MNVTTINEMVAIAYRDRPTFITTDPGQAWLDPAKPCPLSEGPMDSISQVILAALRVHPSRSVGQAELATLAGCTHRQVRRAVTFLRRQGWLVMGDGSGYHFARNIEEVKHLLKQISDQVDRLEALQEALCRAAQSRFGGG